MALLTESTFKAPWWLKSSHLQTIWPSLNRPRLKLDISLERINLRDGDFIDLAWHGSEGPLVMIVHGLEGSLESHYATTMLNALNQAGFSTLFMHLRGCSGEPNRLPRSYHSGATEDLLEILEHLHATDRRPDAVVGFSLGGNLLLKYLGESGKNSHLRAAVAVSVPFNLAHAAQRLEQGFSRLYGRYLLRKLLRSHRIKCRNRSLSSPVDLSSIDTIYEFDDKITSVLNGFANADDYYSRCSSRPFLKNISTPTLILHAIDDPFMLPEDAPTLEELGPGITLELSHQGGHVGFVQGSLPWRPEYWLDQRIPAYLKNRLLDDESDSR